MVKTLVKAPKLFLPAPWPAILRTVPDELAAYRAKRLEARRVALDVEPILSPDIAKGQARKQLNAAQTGAEIEAAVKIASDADIRAADSTAVFAARQLKRKAALEVFEAVRPLVAAGRQWAANARNEIREREAELFAGFGVSPGKTDLVKHVETFEASLDRMEQHIRIFSNPQSPPMVPGFAPFDEPSKPVETANASPYDPRESMIARRIKLDLAEQAQQQRIHDRTVENIKSPNNRANRARQAARVRAGESASGGDGGETVQSLGALTQLQR